MPAKLLWTPQAREDLLDTYVAIGIDNPAAAERLYSTIEARADLLINYPRIGVRPSKDSRDCSRFN
jgi:toxin ParE1/3/4